MRALTFAKRNFKELIRDYMSLIFLIAMPLFFLCIFSSFNIPTEEYRLENFTPSIVIFSYSFISLFTATLVAKDKSTSLTTRLFASPMKKKDYILGYTLAVFPIAVIQSIIFFAVAVLLGLEFSINVLWCILLLIPMSLLFVGIGVLLGIILTDKQAPSIGSVVVQLVAFTSGMWFPVTIAGGFFEYVCKTLPFYHAVEGIRGILAGSFNILNFVVIAVYTVVIYVISSVIFKAKMLQDNK